MTCEPQRPAVSGHITTHLSQLDTGDGILYGGNICHDWRIHPREGIATCAGGKRNATLAATSPTRRNSQPGAATSRETALSSSRGRSQTPAAADHDDEVQFAGRTGLLALADFSPTRERTASRCLSSPVTRTHASRLAKIATVSCVTATGLQLYSTRRSH